MHSHNRHPSVDAVLQFFAYNHLPYALQEISEPFSILAHNMVAKLDGPELTVGLRKLLESKDCMVRAALSTQSTVKVPASHPSGTGRFRTDGDGGY